MAYFLLPTVFIVHFIVCLHEIGQLILKSPQAGAGLKSVQILLIKYLVFPNHFYLIDLLKNLKHFRTKVSNCII